MNCTEGAAIVTGGGSGLGEATARLLAKRGARVSIFDQNLKAAKAVAEQIGGVALQCDVTDPKGVQKAISESAALHGGARILVNCAGVGDAGRAVGKDGALPLESFDRVVDVNLIGTFNVIRLFAEVCLSLEPVEDDERGVIVNTASIAAFDGQVGQAAYSASKGGVASMTLPLAREFAKRGIRVNAIAPGIFDTPLLRAAPQSVQQQLASLIPFPHRLGKPEEFAMLALHICENAMLNGETIRLDGAVRLS
ncbi:SDR family NAD(P)-dependent oxidoreductase [Pseudorhodoplanes sp.]|uniref:SDR family NAD(P)-dependent oxidoreductase n=1 Tax=Pseudorhodoplanes sp. TaxID=1934341 RepID=UPI003D11A7C4